MDRSIVVIAAETDFAAVPDDAHVDFKRPIALPAPAIARGPRAEDIRDAYAVNTRRAYYRDWLAWEAFCARRFDPMVPDTAAIAAFLHAMADKGRRVSTIERRLSGLRRIFGDARTPIVDADKTIHYALRAIRNKHGTPAKGMKPLLADDIEAILKVLPAGPIGIRDKALILIGFAAGLRRSELVGIRAEHIEERKVGIVITIPRSKTDQGGQGQSIGIGYEKGEFEKYCAVRALKAWMKAASIAAGPVFVAVGRAGVPSAKGLDPQMVRKLLRTYGARAGVDIEGIAGHSLRVGHGTQALMNGADPIRIKDQLRHASMDTTLKYARRTQIFDGNSSVKLWRR